MDYDADGTLGVEAELVFGGPGLYHPARRIMPPDGEEDSLRDLGEKLQIAVQRLHNLRVVAIHVAAQEMISELPPSADKDLLQLAAWAQHCWQNPVPTLRARENP